MASHKAKSECIPYAEPFVPSVRRLYVQAFWWCVLCWPALLLVAGVLHTVFS